MLTRVPRCGTTVPAPTSTGTPTTSSPPTCRPAPEHTNLPMRGCACASLCATARSGQGVRARCLHLARHHHVVLGLKVERAHFRPESDPAQLDFEFVVSVGPARQQFRADKNRPSRIKLCDRN